MLDHNNNNNNNEKKKGKKNDWLFQLHIRTQRKNISVTKYDDNKPVARIAVLRERGGEGEWGRGLGAAFQANCPLLQGTLGFPVVNGMHIAEGRRYTG